MTSPRPGFCLRRLSRVLAGLLLVSVCCGMVRAQTLRVAAASDLQFALQDIAARFQKETGRTVNLTLGSSGNFFSQIQNGAPFDVFFSADIDYPKKLDEAGLSEAGTLYRYATGAIVLWVRRDSTIDVAQGLKVLLDPKIRKIAIANPEHAPYGQAAVAALRHEQMYDQVRERLVLGENISQTAQFVESGNADAGIVALSLALAPPLKDEGRYYEISSSAYPPIEQGVIILKSSKDKETARQFLAFLKRPEIAKFMRSYGFAVPE